MVQRFTKFLLIIFLFLLSFVAQSEVLFEGYAKVSAGGVHVGYFISRYEFDPKKKEFVAITFLKTNELGGNITESLKAVAKDDLTPVAYSFTTLIGNAAKTIDAQFAKGKMTASVKDGDKITKVQRDLPKGSFLSVFLAYVMLKSPKGMSPDTKYEYQAIAEEDAQLQKGIAFIKNIEDLGGVRVYRILNEFKGQKFISLVSEKGEVLSTKSPVQSIITELKSQSSLATVGFQLPTALLKQLFGDVPIGVKNEISRKYQAGVQTIINSDSQDAQNPAPATGKIAPKNKQQGIPQGKGLMLKGTPAPEVEHEQSPIPSEKKGN